MRLVIPKFGPKPKFEPKILRIEPRFSSKFSAFASLDLKLSSGLSRIKEVRTDSPGTFFSHAFFQKISINLSAHRIGQALLLAKIYCGKKYRFKLEPNQNWTRIEVQFKVR